MVRAEQGAPGAVPSQRRRDRSRDLPLIARAAALALPSLLGLLGLLSGAPALAISGTVVDPEARPLPGARVCYLSGDIELLCVSTDEGGFYELPDTELDRIRIGAEGYLKRILAAVDQPAPIPLARAATLLVRVQRRASHEAVGGGEVFVLAANGRRLGPFPLSKAGVRVRSLDPGTVRVKARVEGYRQVEPVEVELVGGKEAVVDVLIAPQPPDEPGEPDKNDEKKPGSG